jgi:hypothetical protein
METALTDTIESRGLDISETSADLDAPAVILAVSLYDAVA